MIDFSKAPEGATHYDDSTKTIGWWKMGPQGWVMNTGYFNGVPVWVGVAGCYALDFKEIPNQNKMIIECKTEREQMLCEQVLRVVRGEASQELVNTHWNDVTPGHIINIDKLIRYRAKPKKELVVPWDILDDCISQVRVNEKGVVIGVHEPDTVNVRLHIKLDLTNIDLPVTVKRPSGEK